ncbi:MAG: SEC-C metal-binding domain-containing protein [Bryobacteraceae bacterium]|jgi:SEC-C motif-containing protein
MSPSHYLTPAQQRALVQLSAGSTTTAAARSAGVHRNTVGNWLRSAAPFRDALAEIRRAQDLASREQARSLAVASPTPPSTPKPSAAQPGRNQPCPCGSGRKFKRCCISKR